VKIRVIRDDCGNPYLVRLSIIELFGYALKLHIILRSDRNRELHDHPWTFWTWMLCGGYWEHTPITEWTCRSDWNWPGRPKIVGTTRTWIAPGSRRTCRSPYPHRLELEAGNPAVTLVLMWPKEREWGFYKPSGWVPWHKYKSEEEC
jgi:hypothetical protein